MWPMSTYTYHWLHIPTQTRGTKSGLFDDLDDLLRDLNEWNGKGNGEWVYWY